VTDELAVAIVGMSGRFPGARDLDEYWANLRAGACSIRDFDADELRAAGVDADDLARPEYVRAKGYLADADRFEAELFGFNRTEAAVLDPQHRLLLEVAWSALEDAGYDPRDTPGRTGVYVGGGSTEHHLAANTDPRLLAEVGGMQLRILTGPEFLAPWVSYRLGLTGPSLTVQTACATSLTAVHLAVQALLLGECDTALAGGVSVDSVAKRGYVYQEGGIYSPDGRCRPFDEAAAGTVAGNGGGVVVLRRLADALADGDPIRAVILGTAVTNDGSAKVGFTAPSVAQQTAAIAEAWAAAGLDPSAAQYLEMHGTGTALGDPVELAAAAAAIGRPATARPCRIGSVKSNVGHLDTAAGVTSLIKVVLMLGHRTMVPMANVTRPHPELASTHASTFRLVDRVLPWDPPGDGPRLAGVSSVGIGGTNAHVVVAEAPERVRPAPPTRAELLPLSARTEPQLRAAARRLAAALRSQDAPALVDVAHTLRTGRTPLPVRDCVLARTADEAARALDALAGGGPRAAGEAGPAAAGADWARGADVRWPESAPGARRVHLPTYPFAGESYGALTLDARRDRAAGPPDGGNGGPARLTEAAVIELVSGSLGRPEALDVHESYIALGGDSLAAIHLADRLRDRFGVDVPIELFLEPLPLAELVSRITTDGDGAGPSLLADLLDEVEASAPAVNP
jgi:acyl transferase domain-containing protein/acyl carrier protein